MACGQQAPHTAGGLALRVQANKRQSEQKKKKKSGYLKFEFGELI